MPEDTQIENSVEIEVPVENHLHNGKLVQKGETIVVCRQTAEMLEKAWAILLKK